MIKHTPNILTLLRIALVPVLVIMLKNEQYGWALMIFIIAGISDGLDGYIAKKFDCASHLGALMDPIADKLLIGSAFIMLAWQAHLPFWLFLVVLFRDLLIIIAFTALTLLYGRVDIKPVISSKINTLVQILFIFLVLFQLSQDSVYPIIQSTLSYVIAATIIISACQYVWEWGINRAHMTD